MAKDGGDINTTFFQRAVLRIRYLAPACAIGFGLYLSSWDSDYWVGIGGNLVAAGGIALLAYVAYGGLWDRHQQLQVDKQMTILGEINDSSKRLEVNKKQDEVAKRLGLEDCYEERPGKEIKRAVLAAEERVDILEVSLDTMRGIKADDWLACKAEVRIILLDPIYPDLHGVSLARLRDREENQKEGQILWEVHEVVNALPHEWSKSAGNSDGSESRVKLAEVMPTMSYFRIDDTAYFAPLVHETLGNETMHIRFKKGGDFFAVLTGHFEALWNNGQKVHTAVRDQIPKDYPSA
jgi:hypothetical protein